MHRLTFSKSEGVIQFNDNLMTQFNEEIEQCLKIQEITLKSVEITEKLETLKNNEHDWNSVKYANVLHHNRTQKQFLLSS